IREKRYGQIGYGEPQPEPEPEKYTPTEGEIGRPLFWRADMHGHLPQKKPNIDNVSRRMRDAIARRALRQEGTQTAGVGTGRRTKPKRREALSAMPGERDASELRLVGDVDAG